MDYTEIPQKIKDKRDEICSPLKPGETASISQAKKDIGYFMYHSLGMKPYHWQYYAFQRYKTGKHQLWCTPRQYLGKSTALAVMALHSVFYNMMPIASKGNKTIVGIISRSDSQSKKMITDIRNLLYQGDEWVARLTGGKVTSYFSSRFSTKKNDANSKTQITLRNPSTGKILGVIKSLPPTDAARGETFSTVFCDEAAFFEDDDFFIHDEAFTKNISLFQQLMFLQTLSDDFEALSVQIADPDPAIVKEIGYVLEEVLASRSALLVFSCELDNDRKSEFEKVVKMVESQNESGLMNYLNSGESHIKGTTSFIAGIIVANKWKLDLHFLRGKYQDYSGSLLTGYADHQKVIFS